MRTAGRAKVSRVLSEYKHDELHSGSKRGPIVKDRAQALAIAINEAKKDDRPSRALSRPRKGGY